VNIYPEHEVNRVMIGLQSSSVLSDSVV
jgi:hypothetical protein